MKTKYSLKKTLFLKIKKSKFNIIYLSLKATSGLELEVNIINIDHCFIDKYNGFLKQ
jgi:hypothetical protein